MHFLREIFNLLPSFLRARQYIKEHIWGGVFSWFSFGLVLFCLFVCFFKKNPLAMVYIVFQFIAAREPGGLFCTEL